jgi:glutathione synthase/RimK-type ligase-like ATP-grasp enzyme
MIFLWGVLEDGPLMAVYQALLRLLDPSNIIFIQQQKMLDTKIDLIVVPHVKCVLHYDNQVIDLCSVTAAYLRPYSPDNLSYPKNRKNANNDAQRHIAQVEDILLSWAELTPALVVNKPSKMASNNSKPYQLAIIQTLGFKIPDTLITTEAKAALEFWEKHGTVIYKSISGIRSIVTRLTLEHLERLEKLSNCPTQFQEYIDGIDYRVHIVGDKVFACQIISSSDDYRYAALQGQTVDLRACVLPSDIVDRCKTLASHMGLSVAGIDLRCTPNDEWYCFEVNPSPAFTYYQEASGHHIDEAITQLLIENRNIKSA